MGSPFLADHGKHLGRVIDSFLGSKTANGRLPYSKSTLTGLTLKQWPREHAWDQKSPGLILPASAGPSERIQGGRGSFSSLSLGKDQERGKNQALCYRLRSRIFWKQRSCCLWLENRKRRNESSEGLSSICPSVSVPGLPQDPSRAGFLHPLPTFWRHFPHSHPDFRSGSVPPRILDTSPDFRYLVSVLCPEGGVVPAGDPGS